MSDQSTTPAAGGGSGDKSIADVILQVLAAVGTGIGVLGFVIFVGGAVIWTRFDAVGVPAAEAVSVVPREVMVATGASVLAPAAALALLVVAGMFIWQTWVQRDDERRAAAQGARLDDAEAQRAAALAAQELATVTLSGLAAAAHDAVTRGAPEELAQLGEDGKRCKAVADEAAKQAADLQSEIDGLRNAQRDHDRERRRAMVGVGGATLFLASASAALLWLGPNGVAGTVVVVGVALLASIVAMLVHARTEKFAWLAATAFVGVGLTFAFAVYFDARGERQVVPAAALVKDRAPVYGFLVAQRDDHVYIGTIDGDKPTDTHVVELDRAKVTDLLLDAHVRRDHVKRDSWQLAHQLCTTHGRDPVPPPSGSTVAVKAPAANAVASPTGADTLCSADEIAALGGEPKG